MFVSFRGFFSFLSLFSCLMLSFISVVCGFGVLCLGFSLRLVIPGV